MLILHNCEIVQSRSIRDLKKMKPEILIRICFILLLITLFEAECITVTLKVGKSKLIEVPLPSSKSLASSYPLIITSKVSSLARRMWNPDLGSIFFSTTFEGSHNSWSLNLTDEREQSISKKMLCFDSTRNQNSKNITVSVFSNSKKEVDLRIHAQWDLEFYLKEEKERNVKITPFTPVTLQYEVKNGSEGEDMFLSVLSQDNHKQCFWYVL